MYVVITTLSRNISFHIALIKSISNEHILKISLNLLQSRKNDWNSSKILKKKLRFPATKCLNVHVIGMKKQM